MFVFRAVRTKAVQLLRRSHILPRQMRQLVQRDTSPHALPVDVYSTTDEVVVVASAVGLKPGDIEICLVGNVLTIEGAFAAPVKNVTYVLQERQTGRFNRKLTLRVDVDAPKATATIREGLLTVVLPKTPDHHAGIVRVPVEG